MSARALERLTLLSKEVDLPPVQAGSLWHLLAAIPGHELALPWGRESIYPSDALDPQFRDVMEHRFRVLAAHSVHSYVDDDERLRRVRARAGELPQDIVEKYRPIEWHSDLHAGYRWDPDTFYMNVRLAPLAGADIKVPRELSRFNHVGALARGPLHDAAVEFVLQLLDWITANPPRRGVNWACTMDVALRVVNWIWGLRLFEPIVAAYPQALQEIRRSIWQHGVHIEQNLEYYEEITNNHYLSNVAGLLYIGAAFPEFPESDRWLRFALQELVSEMHREVLPDGMTDEASTHYHRLVLELFASCAALAERLPPARRERLLKVRRSQHRVRPPLRPAELFGINLQGEGAVLPAQFYERLMRMTELTAALTKPNGRVPQFGDNDSGRVHKLVGDAQDVRDHRHVIAVVAELLDVQRLRDMADAAADEGKLVARGAKVSWPRVASTVAATVSSPLVHFREAGIVIARSASAWLAVICGPNGLHGRGGHGHNDKLSFELNVGGCDFVVDGGCPAYTGAPEVRNRFRSTLAHNTVAVAGQEQEQWAPGSAGLFQLPQRCGRQLTVEADNSIVGSHNGFGAVHRRRFQLDHDRLNILDELVCEGDRILCFNLDPGVTIESISSVGRTQSFRLVHFGGRALVVTVYGAEPAHVTEGCFSIGFGVPVPNLRVTLKLMEPLVQTEMRW